MDKWKPLDPTPKHAPSSSLSQSSSSSSSAPVLDPRIAQLYAAPAQSTRHAPPAKPHPPAAHVAKRRSFLPSWAQGAASSSQYASVAGGVTAKAKEAAKLGSSADDADDEGDDLVGCFPLAVHQAIADTLPVDDLVRYMATCRPLARLVATDEVWLKRARAAQWQDIQSVPVKSVALDPPPPAPAPESMEQTASDDFGDFARPEEASMPKPYSSTSLTEDDSFGDFSGGGSLANGTASLQAPMKPSRPGAGNKSLFSFRSETKTPSCTGIEAYQAIKSYKEALRPFVESVVSSAGNLEESLVFLGPDASSSAWGAREQSTLLGNLIRCSLPCPAGAALFDVSTTKKAATSIDDDDLDGPQRDASLGAGLLQSASVLRSNLLSMFNASSDKRSDALRAASHGASGTDAAVGRAEGDMRIFAVSLWDLGQQGARLKAALGKKEAAASDGWLLDAGEGGRIDSHGDDEEAPGSEAKAAWLKSRQAQLLPLSASTSSDEIADARDNFIFASSGAAPTLNFTPMDGVMSQLVIKFREEGEIIARIFPPEQGVLLAWSKIVFSELITTYIRPLLDFATSHSVHLYLRCCAASFAQSLKLSEAIRSVAPPTSLPKPTLQSAEAADAQQQRESADWRRRFETFYSAESCNDVVYEAWSEIVEEYLVAEREWVKTEMALVADKWEEDLVNQSAASRVDAAFLTAQNPAAVKRSVLTGFKDVLLLPVTVVPRTAVHVGGAVFRTAGKGVSSLNPLNWQASATTSAAAGASASSAAGASTSSLQQPATIKRSTSATGGFFSPGLGRSTDTDAKSNAGQGYIDFSNGGTDDATTAFYGEDEDEDEEDYKGDFEPAASGFDGLDIEDEWNEEVRAWKEVAQKASQTSSEQQQQQQRKASAANKRRPAAAGPSRRPATPISRPSSTNPASQDANMAKRALGSAAASSPGTAGSSRSGTPTPAQEKPTPASLQRMQLLLSLDTALQMIHLNRDSIKRIETFASAAAAGRKGSVAAGATEAKPAVGAAKAAPSSSTASTQRFEAINQEIQEVASSFVRCLGERHVAPGFAKATSQVRAWDPSSTTTTTSTTAHDAQDEKSAAAAAADRESHVEPLVHFFELVHVGDTIAQMVQVYFDQELSRHIDKDDFLNTVVRDKKRFESALDESVAAGLNAGVDLLMSQAEHIITTRQEVKDYYPELAENRRASARGGASGGVVEKKDVTQDLDLGRPTPACSEALLCLTTHCRLLIGCADKSILEVFWQEIGLRLHSILCKHIKRQVISLTGGFKIIDDLNAYHHFVATQLRQPSLLPYFEALQALGSLYIVEEPRELAHLVRDAGSLTRGTLGPDDVYEFLQARGDFKRIERDVDREMYGFKMKEDCSVM